MIVLRVGFMFSKLNNRKGNVENARGESVPALR
jgi:hypothetical protein